MTRPAPPTNWTAGGDLAALGAAGKAPNPDVTIRDQGHAVEEYSTFRISALCQSTERKLPTLQSFPSIARSGTLMNGEHLRGVAGVPAYLSSRSGFELGLGLSGSLVRVW